MKLNRLQRADATREEHQARVELGTTPRYRRMWASRHEPLDQGVDGQCVGFATASLLGAAPIKHTVSKASAQQIFRKAQEMDQLAGLTEDTGASLLGAMEACQKVGLFGSYVWCETVDDVIDWIVRRGPVLLGVNWYQSMDKPSGGLLEIQGRVVGGHAIMANGYWPRHPDFGDVVVVTNSYGPGWGVRGRGFLPIDVLARLISEDGDAVAPTDIPPHRR